MCPEEQQEKMQRFLRQEQLLLDSILSMQERHHYLREIIYNNYIKCVLKFSFNWFCI